MKKLYILTTVLFLSVLLVACTAPQPAVQESSQMASLQQQEVQQQEIHQEEKHPNTNEQSVVNKPASSKNEIVKNPAPSQTVSYQKVTKDNALNTALTHAGILKKQAKFIENEYDLENGVGVYEIEFRVGSDEYEYRIHAKTKEILKAEKNNIDLLVSQERNTISPEKAKSLVLQHAKVSSSKIRDYKIELETKQGNLVYEIEFEESKNEYDYTLDAQTGEILYSKTTID